MVCSFPGVNQLRGCRGLGMVSGDAGRRAFDDELVCAAEASRSTADATVDRLMHHAHVCQTAGDSISIRLSQALAGKGVIPLS